MEKPLRAVLDPVSTVELKIFLFQPPSSETPDARRQTATNVLGLAVKPIIDKFKVFRKLAFEPQDPGDGTLNLYWAQEEKFGELDAYRPLIIRISVESGKWPRLSFIKGFPVLSLPLKRF